MEFRDNYKIPMDRGFYSDLNTDYFKEDIEGPISSLSEIKPSVIEGKIGGGSFRDVIEMALRRGARGAELNQLAEGEDQNVGSESYGKEVREDIKNLAKFNKFKITVHSPTRVANLSGFTGDSFSPYARETSLNEIKKSIDFAADISSDESAPENGIAVVVHTGEFPRAVPFAGVNPKEVFEIDEKTGKIKRIKRSEFLAFENEIEKTPLYLVDEKTGRIIRSITIGDKIPTPEWTTAKEYYERIGKKVKWPLEYYDERLKRKVKLNPDDFVNEKGELALTPDERIPSIDENGNVKVKTITLSEMLANRKKILDWLDRVEKITEGTKQYNEIKEIKEQLSKIRPELFFVQESLLSEKRSLEGQAGYFSHNLNEIEKQINKIREVIHELEEIKEKVGEDTFKKLFKKKLQDPELANLLNYRDFSEEKNVLDILRERERALIRNYKHLSEASMGYLQRAKEVEEMLKRLKPLDEFAKEKSADSIAELGIYAYQKTADKKLKKPIYIAPENVFPEMGYGSHPEELADLIRLSRQKMVDKLTKFYNMSKKEAEKIAREHIKATLDTQHLSMWYRYFNPEGKRFKNEEERKKAFIEWYKKQIEKLAKEGIIGHVHLVDGFGRAHTHLPAGEGEMPLKEAIEILKKHKVPFDIISEGYSEGPIRQLTKVWREFDIPVSALGRAYGSPLSWTDLEHSYFDKMDRTRYVVGDYVPDKEEWKMWSELPLE